MQPDRNDGHKHSYREGSGSSVPDKKRHRHCCRHQNQRRFTTLQGLLNEPKVYLGLTAAGDAV